MLSALCALAALSVSEGAWNYASDPHQHRLFQAASSGLQNSNGVMSEDQSCRLDLSEKLGPEAAAIHATSINIICSFKSYGMETHDPKLKFNTTLKFIHIPKVAGSTIEEFGLKRGFRWGRHDKTGLVSRTSYPHCWGSQAWHGIPNGVQNENVKTFCVIRDPYDRAVSEIRYELTFRGDHDVQCPSPAELNQLIMKQMNQSLQERNWPCHWIAQFRYMDYCDHVLRMDHLDEDLQTLGNHYGVDLKLDGTHSMNDAAKLGDCELDTSMFTSETKAILEREYYIDAELVKLLDDDIIGNKDRLGLTRKIKALKNKSI